MTYSFLAYRLTWKHKHKIDNNFSYEEGINLDWLRYCIYGTGIIFLTATVIIILRDGLGMQFSFNADFIFYTLIVNSIFVLAFKVLSSDFFGRIHS